MQKLLRKKTETGKIVCVATIVLAVLWITLLVLATHFSYEMLSIPFAVTFVIDITALIVYLVVYLPLQRSVKFLDKNGLDYIVDDIDLESPTLPKSKIYCGKRGFYSKKSHLIIPYGEIAWTHVQERRSHGIPVGKMILIYMKDGKKFSLEAKTEDFKWLLANYVFAASPDVVTGYGAEQIKRVRAVFPEVAAAVDRANKLTGIFLMAVGAIFVALLFIIPEPDSTGPLIFCGLIFFGIGLFSFVSGIKK